MSRYVWKLDREKDFDVAKNDKPIKDYHEYIGTKNVKGYCMTSIFIIAQ